jgi:ketosteroid isomerase-like protein
MRTKTSIGLLACMTLALFLCITTPNANAASAEDEVLQVITNFSKAITNKDSKLLSSLYLQSPKTTYFGPGQDGAFLTQGWLTEGPDAVELDFFLHHPQATVLSDNVAVATGYITAINIDPSTKQQSSALIRQTLVVQKVGGKWLIVHEHASFLPTK